MRFLFACMAFSGLAAIAQPSPQVTDVPTRDGVAVRVVYLSPPQPKATVLLFAGGHGGLQLSSSGSLGWGKGNFLVRSRQLFVDQGVAVVLVDAPSDRQSPPYLSGFRQTPGHVADVKSVVAWARTKSKAPVWLVGTSRGTQSAAYLATELQDVDAPDGIVLTSSILSDRRGRPVTAMPLERIHIPVLVVHHEQDGCELCAFSDVPALMGKLTNAKRKELLAFKGGESRGDPCEAFAHHGFNGQESEVVARIVAWMAAR